MASSFPKYAINSDVSGTTREAIVAKTKARVSEKEVVLLGLVAEDPIHAYGLEQKIRDRHIVEWADIALSSIYRVLDGLTKKRLITTRLVQAGQGAARNMHEITDRGRTALADYSGLARERPALMGALAISFLSFIGVPPLAGFIGKFYLFAAVIARGGFWYVLLACIGVLNSAVSLFYYMKIARAMWFTESSRELPAAAASHSPRAYAAVVGILAVPTLVLGIYWAPLSELIKDNIAIYRSPRPPPLTAQLEPTPRR